MRLLWIGKAATDGAAGDEIYDRRILGLLREMDQVDVATFHPSAAAPLNRATNVLRGYPWYRDRYMSEANTRAARGAAAEADVVLVSWEPFDGLVPLLGKPAIPILHNVTSLSLRAMYPSSVPARLLSMVAARWERTLYGRLNQVVVLSLADQQHIQRIAPRAAVTYAPPGMPKAVPLSGDARFEASIILSGTYGWRPKRRDLLAFVAAYRESGLDAPVFADGLPSEVAGIARPMADLDPASAIRIGVIPDRFSAGHKLKVAAYVAMNAVPVAFCDLGEEFACPEAPDLILDKATPEKLAAHIRYLEAMPPLELRSKWDRLQAHFVRRFSWEATAAAICEVAEQAVFQSSR